MAELTYVFTVYIGNDYEGTYLITPSQLEKGEFGQKFESAMAKTTVRWDETNAEEVFKATLKDVAINDAIQFVRFYAEHIPPEKQVTIGYYRTRRESSEGYPIPQIQKPTIESIKAADKLRGPTFIAVDFATMQEREKEYEQKYYEERGFTLQKNAILTFISRAADEGYGVEFREFYEITDLSGLLAESDTGKYGWKFSRVIIFCHGISPIYWYVPEEWKEDQTQEWVRSEYELATGSDPYVDAAAVLGEVADYIKPEGFLYIVACGQFAYNWQYHAAETPAKEEFDIICVPGAGGRLDIKWDEDWGDNFADEVFGPRRE